MKKLLFIIVPLIALSLFLAGETKAGVADNVSGWAWSENIGWISFNGINYGVNINLDGTFSGYAWSENIGWISFNPGDIVGCPTGSCQAVVNLGNGEVSGWARVLSYGGGWDGWIKLRGTDYGVSIDTVTGEFSGWAWSDMVIGWISFNCENEGGCAMVDYGISTDPDLFNSPPDRPTIPLEYQPTGVSWLGECDYAIPISSFHWTYSDPDDNPLGTDPQTAYEVRIDNDSDFSVVDGDEYRCSGAICTGGSSTSFAPQTAEWIDWAEHSNVYYWIVRVKDSNDSWSEWSDVVFFSTPQHTYPGLYFIHTPKSPAVDEIVTFIDQSTCYDINNNPYGCQYNLSNRYQWDFDDDDYVDCDSNIDSLCRGNATTSYPEKGNYTVRLCVTDDLGTCDGTGDTPISTQVSLPEYKEVPPTIFWNRFLADILLPFKNLLIMNND